MIRHIVFFKAKPDADKQDVYDGLRVLCDSPECRRLEVAANLQLDELEGEHPDFVVYGEFDDEAQLARFKAHPLYHQSVARVRPLRSTRISADFLASSS